MSYFREIEHFVFWLLPKIFKMFFSANEWIFRQNILVFKPTYVVFFNFSSYSIVSYIILKLRPSQTQNFRTFEISWVFLEIFEKEKRAGFFWPFSKKIIFLRWFHAIKKKFLKFIILSKTLTSARRSWVNKCPRKVILSKV